MNKSPKKSVFYCKAVTISHGLCEQIFVEEVKKALRLSIGIKSKANGSNSIQINSLNTMFHHDTDFRTMSSFLKNYSNIEVKRDRPQNLKIFPIMDTDDASESNIIAYKNNTLITNHELSEYIYPIYNTPSLDEVCLAAGLIDRLFHDNEKRRGYEKLFLNLNKKYGGKETVRYLRDTLAKIYSTKVQTNISEFLNYCLLWEENK